MKINLLKWCILRLYVLSIVWLVIKNNKIKKQSLKASIALWVKSKILIISYEDFIISPVLITLASSCVILPVQLGLLSICERLYPWTLSLCTGCFLAWNTSPLSLSRLAISSLSLSLNLNILCSESLHIYIHLCWYTYVCVFSIYPLSRLQVLWGERP